MPSSPRYIFSGKLSFLIPVFAIIFTVFLVGYFTDHGYHQKPVASPTPNVLPAATFATPIATSASHPKTSLPTKTYIDPAQSFQFSYLDDVFILECDRDIYIYSTKVRNDGQIDCKNADNAPLALAKAYRKFNHDEDLVEVGQLTEVKTNIAGVPAIEQSVSQLTKSDITFKKRFFVENSPVFISVTLNDLNLETVYEEIRNSFSIL